MKSLPFTCWWTKPPEHGSLARRFAALAVLAVLVGTLPLLGVGPASHRDVRVILDGATVTFEPPPLEREGLVFVPLRPVFERLGARVQFDAGLTRATSGEHTIELRVGDANANIDGEEHVLESPARLVDGHVMVPLRFVSVALGATVDFNDDSATVTIVRAVSTPVPVPPTPAPISLRPIRLEPANGATIARKRPEISGSFPEAIDPNSIVITLDGNDITSRAYVSDRSFVYDTSTDLAPGVHGVAISGKTPDREPFSERWSFTSGDAAQVNYINGLEPPNGTFVGSAFPMSAFTKPRAHVHIVASTSATLTTFSEVAESSSTVDVTADKRGYFAARLSMTLPNSGIVDVRIASQARDGSIAVRTLRLRQ